MSFKLTGLRNLERKFTYELKKIDSGTSDGLTNAAVHLYNLSQPMVPVDTGRLKASGTVTVTGEFSRTVGYYAEDPESGYDYAPIQHEMTSFRHTIGTAKFLETPFRLNMSKLIDIVGESVSKEIK